MSRVTISIERLAKELGVSPTVVRALIEHHPGTNAAEGELLVEEVLPHLAAEIRLQLNQACQRRLPELYLG